MDRAEGTCGQTLVGLAPGHSGVISSPNYPDDYPDDIKCAWWLKTEVVGPADYLPITTFLSFNPFDIFAILFTVLTTKIIQTISSLYLGSIKTEAPDD